MSQTILDSLSLIRYWRVAIWKLYAGTFITAAGAAVPLIIAWDKMTGTEKVVAVIGGIVAIHKFWDGFIDQTVARLASGKTIIPIEEGK